jgi:hypothetical protein
MPADSRRAEWIADSAVPLGRDLYEDLPVHERPVWAARVLGTCLRHLDLEVSALGSVRPETPEIRLVGEDDGALVSWE